MPSATAATITVQVLLFASYADLLHLDKLELVLDHRATAGDVLARLRALPGGEKLPPRPLCALNLSQVSLDTQLSSGDELAVLPPLAGG
jgi:sulfur-carrier protein